jgi:tripartite-type tricarboxylate transporter receptor subunit TctC
MRNILILTLLSLLVTVASVAKENVTIVYSWTAADGPANYSRLIIEEANRLQRKYNFMFDTKPGAGGSIAANYVKNTPNTILATASAFFVRPNFFPLESYDLAAYREIFLQCTAPMAITAIKYKTWADVPKDRPLTIGVSGLGTTTHLFATQIQAKYSQLTVVPFKSTSESLLSVAAGHTDLHVAFLGEVETWGADNPKYGKLLVLGISGNNSVRGFQTLVSQGFGTTVANISVPFHLVVPANIPQDRFNEWRQILIEAGKNSSVKETYRLDACVPGKLNDAELIPWYHTQVEQWYRLSSGIKITP